MNRTLILFIFMAVLILTAGADSYAKTQQNFILNQKTIPFTATNVDPFIAEKYGLPDLDGVYVVESSLSNVLPGDIVFYLNGYVIRDLKDIDKLIAKHAQGKFVYLDIIRNGQWVLSAEAELVPTVQSYQVETAPGGSLYHALNSGHLYGEKIVPMSVYYAKKFNYKPCKICFSEQIELSQKEKNLAYLGWEYIRKNYYLLQPDLINNSGERKKAYRLIKIADKINQDSRNVLPPRIYILDSEDINAFAICDGSVLITKGLLDVIESDDEMAAVIAHEMSHIAEKHMLKRFEAAENTNLAATLITSIIFVATTNKSMSDQDIKNNAQLLQLGANFFSALYSSGYSQDNEKEADKSGLSYMIVAGYSSKDMVRLMKKFETLEKQHPNYTLFKTHPSERVSYLLSYIDNWKQAGYIK
jgi:Zn-dependent protease with chaperone function